jgi:IS1 family transposase
MNLLPREKQLAIVTALVEGVSVRGTSRMTGVTVETILKLLVKVGAGSAALLDETMRELPCERLEIDELWAFVEKKQRNVRESDDASRVGDTWTYVAIDATTKLVPCFMTGKRNDATTRAFINDLASRLQYRVQISTDGLRMYASAIRSAFGGNVDYATIVKSYESDADGPGRYSPPKVTSTEKTPVFGAPIADLVSTSYVERQNLTMRMQIRRFTRLTNAHSKKLENHGAAIALHFAHYNFCRIHTTIRCTPAMAAGVSPTVWSLGELLEAALARAVAS